MKEYLTAKEGDEKLGFSWDVYEVENGKIRCIGQFLDETFAREIPEIIKWRDALMVGGKVEISTMETPIDVWTGKPWVRPLDLDSIDIRITKTRKPRLK